MSYRPITCPESAHLEMIELVEDPLGLLVIGCTRFRPPCAVECARTCTARLDQRARLARGTAPPAPAAAPPAGAGLDDGDDTLDDVDHDTLEDDVTDLVDLTRDDTYADALDHLHGG